jgi:benzoyl-CoA reductase/2-hydroxyglutaryl-CoA dehydratase subunit BcrC/BadD/HgdB
MVHCGIPRQRFSEFKSGKRKVTGLYFLKMMEGLTLTIEKVEEKTGKKFTEAQKRELQIEAFVNAHRDLIGMMVDNPASIKLFEQFLIKGK